MKPTVEERLVRAGRTLDATTAGRTVAEPPPSISASRAPSLAGGRLTGVAAALVAVVVVGVAVLAVKGSGSDSTPATAAAQLSTAVEGTRSVPAMAVDIHGNWSFAPDGAEAIWNYGAPDRWEQLTQSDQPRLERSAPGGATVRLYVGDKTWTTNDGRWQAEVPASAVQPGPLSVLDQLAATDCAVEEDGQIIAWSSGTEICPDPALGIPSDLPTGTWVWVVILDDDGRLHEVRTGETADLGDNVNLHGQRDPLGRVGALDGGSARFWYDNISEVSGEPAE